MTFAWRATCAALLPIALADVPRALDRFLTHLSRQCAGFRERRAAIFYRNLQTECG
jgi:hypothetical protein